MRKGHFILIALGLALLAFLYFSPLTPPVEASQAEDEAVNIENSAEMSPDAQVDQALQDLQNGTTPPMQAILKIKGVADEHPDNLKAQFTLGILSIQSGQFDKAVERFTNLVAIDDSQGEYWKLLAEAQFKSGDTIEARKNFEKALLLVDDETGDRFKNELPALF